MKLKSSSTACLLRGFLLLKRRSFRSLVLIPLAINVVLYALALWVTVRYFGAFLESLLPQWLEFLKWLLWPLFGLAYVLLVTFTFTLFANILGAPFYGVLAERILAAEGVAPSDKSESLLKSTLASMAIEARRVVGYLLRAVPLLLLFLIPGLNVAAPFVWLVFSAWFLAQDYFSYPFEAQRVPYVEQRRILRGLGADRLVFGGLVQLGLGIPLLNVFVSPAAVAGATLFLAIRFKSGQGGR